MDRRELIETLGASRSTLLVAARKLPMELEAAFPTSDEWSVVEVIAHLVDTDYFYLGEALAMRDSAGHHFRYFDDEAWKLTHPEVRRLTLATCLSALHISHQAVLDAIQKTTDEQLTRAGIHPRGVPYAVGDVFQRIATHDDVHKQQIEDILATLT